ncbi:MAG: hypothetical protein AAFQ22_14505 [Pseudomonadota bacterium]
MLAIRVLAEDVAAAETLSVVFGSLEAAFSEDGGQSRRVSNIATVVVNADENGARSGRNATSTLCIWSATASGARHPAKLLPTEEAEQRQIHALLPDANILQPWTEEQAGKLEWLQAVPTEQGKRIAFVRSLGTGPHARDFWDLLTACYRLIGASAEMRYCLYRYNSQRSHIETGERARRLWRYSDLEEMAKRCAPQVRDFAPDAMFSFDARGGQWAMTLSQIAGIKPAIHVGFRLKRGGLRRRNAQGQQSPIFEACSVIRSDRWELYLPPALSRTSKDTRIIFVDDYSRTGDTCSLWRDHMICDLGFSPGNLCTLTLFTTKETDLTSLPGHIYGWQSDARVNSLVYMHQR